MSLPTALPPTSPLTQLATSPPPPSSPTLPHTNSSNARRRRRQSSSHSDTSSESASSESSSSSLPRPRTVYPHTSSGPYRRPRRGRDRRRLSAVDKLRALAGLLRDIRWNFKEVLRTVLENGEEHTFRRFKNDFLDFAYEEVPAECNFQALLGKSRSNALLDNIGRPLTIGALVKELSVLSKSDNFANFQVPTDARSRGSLDTFASLPTDVFHQASTWSQLFKAVVMANKTRRTHSDGRDRDSGRSSNMLPGWQVTVIATLCHVMSPNKSTNFQSILGLYLYQGGARRRVLETLNRMGLCVSYSTIQLRLADLTVEAKKHIQEVGSNPDTVVAYDNFDFVEGRRGERTGDTRTFRSITNALVFKGRCIPDGGLRQEMWQPSKFPLEATQIAKTFSDSSLLFEQVITPFRLLYNSIN